MQTTRILHLLCWIVSAISAQPYYSSFSEGNNHDLDEHSSAFSSSSSNSELEAQQVVCRGEWKHPPDCSSPQSGNSPNSPSCDYRAAWEYRDEDDHIVFTISTKNRNKWTGIGFSENQHMPQTDAILGLVEESGRFFLMDSWLQAYEAPPLDPIQNLYNQTAWRENGITTLKFSRPRQTGDSRDYQFSDTSCPYFVFPVMGGVFNAVNKRIRKHEATPVVSERRICVRSCRPSLASSSPTVISTSSSSSSSSSSASTTTLAPTSTTSYKSAHGETTSTMTSNSSSSSAAAPTTSKPTATFEEAGEEGVGGGGNHEVHDYREISPVDNTTTTTDNAGEPTTRRLSTWINNALNSIGFSARFTEDEQKWIIIGVGISALVLLALIQALCMFCRCADKEQDIHHHHFADRGGLPTTEDGGYLDEKDNADKQWKEYNSAVAEQYHHQHHHHHNGGNGSLLYNGGYNGYEEYAPANGHYAGHKSNSLHKNYGARGAGHQDYPGGGGGNYHPSLDRRHYEQQLMQQNGRSRGGGGHSHPESDHHHGHPRQSNGRGYSMQPDYYFMPHQRKYSSDVVRVFVDYDHQ